MSSKKSTALAALPSMPTRSRSRNAAPQDCKCGCGNLTKGGNYIPGHDARLLGWAIRVDRGFSVDGITPGELKAAKAFIAGHDAKFDRHFPGGRKHGAATGKGRTRTSKPAIETPVDGTATDAAAS